MQVTGPPDSNGGPNQVTVSSYNSDGELTAQTAGYGTTEAATVSYCYSPDGQQTSVVSADGNTAGVAPCETSSPWVVSAGSYPTQASYQTTSSYDSAGQLVSTTAPATAAAPGGATTTFTYDGFGNMLTSTDPKGVTTTRTYTPSQKLATVSYSGSAAPPVSYTYDAQGTRTGMTDGTGTSSYQFDPFGELTSASNGAGQTVSYSYNPDGQPAGITYPLPASATWASTPTVSYGYDNADQLASVTDFTGHQITITPNADGEPASQVLGSSGDTVNYSYTGSGALSAIALANTSSTLQSFTYAGAPDGQILTETDVPSSPTSPASYSYDPQGRIASMTPGSGSALTYAFDASGNLTALPAGATGGYDHAGELTSATASATTTYSYDPDGQRLTAQQGPATIAAATWNGAGELASYNSPAADMTAASYDGDGMRASATTGSGTQAFTWDGSRLLMDSANAYIYDGGTAPAEQVSLSSGTASYLSADALGSVRGIISPSGALTASTSYDAWGNPLTSGGLASSTPFGYAGGYTDPTGLIYLINRYYDPGTGQFLSVDPAGSQTGQPYGYAGGDPVNAADPSGLWAVGLPWAEAPTDTEFNFRDWVNYEIFGDDANPEFKLRMRGYKNRIIDLYYRPSRTFGWLNELKIGGQSNSSAIQSELFRDEVLTLSSGLACHPRWNQWGDLPCDKVPIKGYNYMFRYKDGNTCQMSVAQMWAANLCPTLPLIHWIFHDLGHPPNLVLFYYVPQDEDALANIFRHHRAQVRNALESNSCPYKALQAAGLPFFKYDAPGCAE